MNQLAVNPVLSLVGLLLFGFCPLPVLAQTCSPGNPQSTAYILRDRDRRCEGVRAFESSGDFSLISFTTGRIVPNSNPLRLQIPTSQSPQVRVRSLIKSYQLDPLEPFYRNDRFQVQWSNYVLKREGIPYESLRATAFIRPNSQTVYLPVILGQTDGGYRFVIFSGQRAKIKTFQILQNGKPVFSTSRNNFQPKGQITIPWDGHSVPKGRYQLLVQADLEQGSTQTKPGRINLTFDHDPQWLK